MRNEDIQKEIDRMTNNRFVTDSIGTMEEQKEFDNKRNYVMIEKLITDVVTQLDKDPMDQMVDTETIIREFTKKIVKECAEQSISIGRYNTPNGITPDLSITIAVGLKKHFGVE